MYKNMEAICVIGMKMVKAFGAHRPHDGDTMAPKLNPADLEMFHYQTSIYIQSLRATLARNLLVCVFLF